MPPSGAHCLHTSVQVPGRHLQTSSCAVGCFHLLLNTARDGADVQLDTHAGETAEEVQHVSRQLRASGIGSILAYSVESDVDAGTATACQTEAAEVHLAAFCAGLPGCMCSSWCQLLRGSRQSSREAGEMCHP